MEQRPGVGHVVALHGDLTIATAREQLAQLVEGLAAFPSRLDLSAVTRMDGAGLQLLLLARRESDRQPFPFGAIDTSPCVRTALALARLGADLRPLAPAAGDPA